ARMVCLPTGAVVGASCVLFYQSGRRSRHPRVPSTGKASILSCEFLLFSRTNSRALGNLCSKLNCASLPRPQGRAGARLFQQPDLENHWVPMRNRALPSVMAFVAQATGFRNAEWGMRNAEEIRIELTPNSAFRIPHFFRSLGF